MLVPFVAEAIASRSRRLASLRAIRSEVSANLEALRDDVRRESIAARIFGDTPLALAPQTAIKDALAGDAALWGDETREQVLRFYGLLYLLRRRIEAHEAVVRNKVLIPPKSIGGLTLREEGGAAEARRGATELRDSALVEAEKSIKVLGLEIESVENWSA